MVQDAELVGHRVESLLQPAAVADREIQDRGGPIDPEVRESVEKVGIHAIRNRVWREAKQLGLGTAGSGEHPHLVGRGEKHLPLRAVGTLRDEPSRETA
jgi:hypothetical protein